VRDIWHAKVNYAFQLFTSNVSTLISYGHVLSNPLSGCDSAHLFWSTLVKIYNQYAWRYRLNVIACTSVGPRSSRIRHPARQMVFRTSMTYLETIHAVFVIYPITYQAWTACVVWVPLRTSRTSTHCMYNYIPSVQRLCGVSTVQISRTSTHCMYNHIPSVRRLCGVRTVRTSRTRTHCMYMQNSLINEKKGFYTFSFSGLLRSWWYGRLSFLYIVRMSIHIDVTIQPICIGMTHSTWCFTSATCEWSLPTDLPLLGLVSCCTTQLFACRSSL